MKNEPIHIPAIGQTTLTRAEYMAGRCTHRQYYAQFVAPGLVNAVADYIGKPVLLNSTNRDGCFNDIELDRWDGAARNLMRGHMVAELKAVGDGYSLAGGVCIMKEAAQQWVDKVSI